MNGHVLFAATPRAGELGHRFLVPVDLSVTESEIAKFFELVDNDLSIGENYVAVERKVTQRIASGAIREGREVVLLAGIDVPEVSSTDLAKVLMTLKKCLDKLDQLVSGGVDWTDAAAVVIVRRNELQQWLKDLPTDLIPEADWQSGPRQLGTGEAFSSKPGKRPVRNSMWYASALVVVVACAGYFRLLPFIGDRVAKRHTVDTNGVSRPQPQASPDAAQPQQKGTSDFQSVEAVNGLKVNHTKLRTPRAEVTTEDSQAASGFIHGSPTNRPVSEPGEMSRLLRNAIQNDKVDALVGVLTLLTGSDRIATQDLEALIDFTSRLSEKKRFLDVKRLAAQISKLQGTQSVDQSRWVVFEDNLRKADEECQQVDQQDISLYEPILASTDEQQVEAARRYLESGPQKAMSRAVEDWIKWAEQAVDVEVLTIDLPTGSPRLIRFVLSSREIICRVNANDRPASSRPLVFKMTHLGVTPRKLPASVTIEVEDDTHFLGTGPFRFSGELQINRGSKHEVRVKLQSNTMPKREGTMTVRLPLIEAPPELPDWRRVSP